MAALLKVDVLLADDDENDVILIRRAFKHVNCIGRFVVLADGEQVLEYLQGHGQYSDRTIWPVPGVVVLDASMPRLSGIEVLSWLRTEPRFSKLPVVLLSGGLPPAEQATLIGLQAAFCAKSVDTKESAHLLEEAIINALTLARGGWFRNASSAFVNSPFIRANLQEYLYSGS
jgi:CheY-like chemotaxis protein